MTTTSSVRVRLVGAIGTVVSLLAAAPALAGTPRPHPRHHRVPAAAALEQLTGLAPSQVQAQSVCPAPAPGYVQCEAERLVLRSTHEIVHARTPRYSFSAEIFDGDAKGFAALTPPAAQTPPAAGTPAYLQQAYDLSYVSQSGGTAAKVAIVDAQDDPNAESDLATYRSQFGLPACTTDNGCFEKVNEQGQSSPLPAPDTGWSQEISLDLDAVSALCPNCHIILVEASSSSNADMSAADAEAAALGANVISDSWAEGSQQPYPGTFTFTGVATVASAGDTGYMSPYWYAYPAALPGVTAAGGTTLRRTHDRDPHRARLQRGRVVAERRLGRRLGLRHRRGQAVVADRHLPGPGLRGRVG